MTPIEKALHEISQARSRPSVRFLDAIYGSAAAPLRARVATILADSPKPFPKSHKAAQFGNVRTALLNAVGAVGGCIAAKDHDFEEKAAALVTSRIGQDEEEEE